MVLDQFRDYGRHAGGNRDGKPDPPARISESTPKLGDPDE
jgi:hypothetical protein